MDFAKCDQSFGERQCKTKQRVINHQFKANRESQNSLAVYKDTLIFCSRRQNCWRSSPGLDDKESRTPVKIESTSGAQREKGNL